MKNKLTDLNNHLFAQLERLSDESLSQEQLGKELERTKGVVSLASQIVSNGRLVLDGERFRQEFRGVKGDLPAMLEGK